MRPPLPPLDTRVDRFDLSVGTAAEFLRSAWPELRDVRFEVADMPAATDDDGIPRWTVLPDERRIILYRLPIERLSHLHRDDDLHRRMLVEGSVFRAAAEYLDRDGNKQILEADGLLATCLQHEMDHLNGVLFIDHLSRLKRGMAIKKLTKLKKLEAAG